VSWKTGAAGKAAFVRVHTLPRAGSWDRVLAGAERAAEALEPHASAPGGTEVLGMLTLSASLSAAVVQNRGQARHWLGEAADLARRVPDTPDRNWMAFSDTNVVSGGSRSAWNAARAVGPCWNWLTGCARQAGRQAWPARCLLHRCRPGLAREAKTRPQAVRWLRQPKHRPAVDQNNPARAGHGGIPAEPATAAAIGQELRGWPPHGRPPLTSYAASSTDFTVVMFCALVPPSLQGLWRQTGTSWPIWSAWALS